MKRTERGTFRSLRVRNYRLYASANVVSLTGTWIQRIAQDWLVLELSDGSGLALGVTAALQFGPMLVFSLVGGLLADRYDKRRLLIVTQSIMGALALLLGLLVVTDSVALWHVFVLAAALGTVSSVDSPVRHAFVSELVGPELLTNAVGLNSTIFNSARMIGPAVAGALIAAASGDTAAAFFVNAVSFAFTIFALLRMRTDELHRSPPVDRARGQFREGVAYARAHPDLRLGLVLAFVMGTFGLNNQVLLALMAREHFGVGAAGFGLLTTCMAVGSVAGGLLSARRSLRPRGRFLIVAAICFGVLLALGGFMPTLLIFAAVLVPTGMVALLFSVACNTFVQLGSDPAMRGRVMALYFICWQGGIPIGAPLVGWLAENHGAPRALVASGTAVVVAGATAWCYVTYSRAFRARGPIDAAARRP